MSIPDMMLKNAFKYILVLYSLFMMVNSINCLEGNVLHRCYQDEYFGLPSDSLDQPFPVSLYFLIEWFLHDTTQIVGNNIYTVIGIYSIIIPISWITGNIAAKMNFYVFFTLYIIFSLAVHLVIFWSFFYFSFVYGHGVGAQ